MVSVNRQLRWLFKAQRGSGGFKANYEAITVREGDDGWKIVWTDPTQVKTKHEALAWDTAVEEAISLAKKYGFEKQELEVQDGDLTEFVEAEW